MSDRYTGGRIARGVKTLAQQRDEARELARQLLQWVPAGSLVRQDALEEYPWLADKQDDQRE